MSFSEEDKAKRIIINKPVDWQNTFFLSEAIKDFKIPVDKNGESPILFAVLVSPGSTGTNALAGGTMYLGDPIVAGTFARVYGTPSGGITDPTPGIVTDSREMIYQAGTNSWVPKLGAFSGHQVSAANTANAWLITFPLSSCLNINSVCSAGTATITVEVMGNGGFWLTIDSIAAAATVTKSYNSLTPVGTTLALSPFGWQQVRVTAGAAGGGNTTTLDVGAC